MQNRKNNVWEFLHYVYDFDGFSVTEKQLLNMSKFTQNFDNNFNN